MPGGDARLVWSDDGGDRRRDRPTPAARRPAPGGRARVRRETSGRRGRAVTTVSDLPMGDDEVRALAGRLKKRCGVGGSVKDGVVELQGDHRETVMAVLADAGVDAVLAGG